MVEPHFLQSSGIEGVIFGIVCTNTPICLTNSVFCCYHCCRYYDLDAHHRRMMEKEMKKGLKKVQETERTIFDDEEQRRYVVVY